MQGYTGPRRHVSHHGFPPLNSKRTCGANLSFLFSRMGGIPAMSSKGEHLLLFIGIIDILQSYR